MTNPKRTIALLTMLGTFLLALWVAFSKRKLILPGPLKVALPLSWLLAFVVAGAFFVAGMYLTGLWG